MLDYLQADWASNSKIYKNTKLTRLLSRLHKSMAKNFNCEKAIPWFKI